MLIAESKRKTINADKKNSKSDKFDQHVTSQDRKKRQTY